MIVLMTFDDLEWLETKTHIQFSVPVLNIYSLFILQDSDFYSCLSFLIFGMMPIQKSFQLVKRSILLECICSV